MTSAQAELIAELDQLIATETVRARHVRLVRARSLAEQIADELDNLISPVGGDAA